MGQDRKSQSLFFSITVKRSIAKYDITVFNELNLDITVIVNFLGKLQK